jgi:hypothetical protein
MDPLTIVRDAQLEVEGWRQRAGRRPPEEPERDSVLARDDKTFAYHRISEMAPFSLVSAGEHLRLVWDGLDCGRLYATAQYTAVRGALAGTAQAVWITEPDDPSTRQRRGHVVIADMYENLRKYHKRTLKFAQQLGLTSDGEQRVNEQIAWIESREQALKAAQPALMKLNLTNVLEDIAPVVFPNDQERQAHLQLGVEPIILRYPRQHVEPHPASRLHDGRTTRQGIWPVDWRSGRRSDPARRLVRAGHAHTSTWVESRRPSMRRPTASPRSTRQARKVGPDRTASTLSVPFEDGGCWVAVLRSAK